MSVSYLISLNSLLFKIDWATFRFWNIWQTVGCQRVTQETCDLWNIWSEWLGNMSWPKKGQRLRKWQRHDMACELVWNCWHFRQLRTWIHDNRCDLTIKSDTGQHLQLLRCFGHSGQMSPRPQGSRVVFLKRWLTQVGKWDFWVIWDFAWCLLSSQLAPLQKKDPRRAEFASVSPEDWHVKKYPLYI